MTPQMETICPFAVLGVAAPLRRGSETPGVLRPYLEDVRVAQYKIQTVATGKLYYGVTFPTADANVTEYLAGMQVPADTPRPDGLEARPIPGGAYAVFECSVDALGCTYQHVLTTWLQSATVHLVDIAGKNLFQPESLEALNVQMGVGSKIPVSKQTVEGLEDSWIEGDDGGGNWFPRTEGKPRQIRMPRSL